MALLSEILVSAMPDTITASPRIWGIDMLSPSSSRINSSVENGVINEILALSEEEHFFRSLFHTKYAKTRLLKLSQIVSPSTGKLGNVKREKSNKATPENRNEHTAITVFVINISTLFLFRKFEKTAKEAAAVIASKSPFQFVIFRD